MTASTEVVVIGGGYAGVMAANRMSQRENVTMTLINLIYAITGAQWPHHHRRPSTTAFG
ncbi:hypothetical protein [Nocardia sp. NPDC058497]|uniref:hypothetical protein n=1 Tax=Nocardia sp. NPDC058497 TaxID=3346529 RepID=UPI003664F2C5